MIVKEFVGLCADRNMEVIITDGIRRQIAKGNVMEVFTDGREELLNSKVGCFYCNDDKLYIVAEGK